MQYAFKQYTYTPDNTDVYVTLNVLLFNAVLPYDIGLPKISHRGFPEKIFY